MASEHRDFDFLPLSILHTSELRELFGCTVADPDFYFRLAYQLAHQDSAWLLAQLPHFDPLRLRAALFALGSEHRHVPLLLAHLEHDNELVVAECLDALQRLEHWQSWSQIDPLARHHSPFVQAAVLRFECAYKGVAALPLLRLALESSHPLLRENALDEMDDLPLPQAQKLMLARPFLADANAAVREAAQSVGRF